MKTGYIYDVVLLSSSSYHFKLCENLSVEDNFNNTFSKLKVTPITTAIRIIAKVMKRFENKALKLIFYSR